MSSEVRDSVDSVRCSESPVPQLADSVDSGAPGVLLRLLSVEQASGWRLLWHAKDPASRPLGSDSAGGKAVRVEDIVGGEGRCLYDCSRAPVELCIRPTLPSPEAGLLRYPTPPPASSHKQTQCSNKLTQCSNKQTQCSNKQTQCSPASFCSLTSGAVHQLDAVLAGGRVGGPRAGARLLALLHHRQRAARRARLAVACSKWRQRWGAVRKPCVSGCWRLPQ